MKKSIAILIVTASLVAGNAYANTAQQVQIGNSMQSIRGILNRVGIKQKPNTVTKPDPQQQVKIGQDFTRIKRNILLTTQRLKAKKEAEK